MLSKQYPSMDKEPIVLRIGVSYGSLFYSLHQSLSTRASHPRGDVKRDAINELIQSVIVIVAEVTHYFVSKSCALCSSSSL